MPWFHGHLYGPVSRTEMFVSPEGADRWGEAAITIPVASAVGLFYVTREIAQRSNHTGTFWFHAGLLGVLDHDLILVHRVRHCFF